MMSRILRRLTLAVAMGALAALLLATPALAGRMWCARDPLVSLDGQQVQLWVAIPQEYEALVTGPIAVQIDVPKGVATETLFLDSGFNGFGEHVTYGRLGNGKRYADGSFDAQVRVQVPIDTQHMKQIPLRLTFTVGGKATEVAAGNWIYTGGTTTVVEMTNNSATLVMRVPISAQ